MSKASLYMKIVAVMNEVGQLQKDGEVADRNGKKMYNYLSEEQTTGELQRAFVKHKLVVFPIKVEPELMMVKITKYDKETEAAVTKVLVTYKIVDAETGEFEEIQSIGYGSDDQDKGSNKAMTGAFKYMQRQTFLISTGDDGDHTSSDELNAKYERPKAVQSAPPAQPQQTYQQRPQAPASRPSTPHSFKRDAYNLRESLFMNWNELQSFAERVLGRKIDGKITALQDEREWEIIARELQQYQKQPAGV